MTEKELISKLAVRHEWIYTAQLYNGSLIVNLSDAYTRLIKDAARCSRFSDDLLFETTKIKNKIDNFDGNEFLTLIGFRKDGVDDSAFVLLRCQRDYYEVYKEYFAFYSFEIRPDNPENFYEIVLTEYQV